MTIKPIPRPVAKEPEDVNANARRFEGTLARALSVPKAELARREAAYQKTRQSKKPRRTTR